MRKVLFSLGVGTLLGCVISSKKNKCTCQGSNTNREDTQTRLCGLSDMSALKDGLSFLIEQMNSFSKRLEDIKNNL